MGLVALQGEKSPYAHTDVGTCGHRKKMAIYRPEREAHHSLLTHGFGFSSHQDFKKIQFGILSY